MLHIKPAMPREEAETKAAAVLERFYALHPVAKGKLRTAEKYNLLHEIADELQRNNA